MPAIGFEGFEKSLELAFFMPSGANRTKCSLLPSVSELSLFVHPYKIILKTCGMTKLLKAVPVLLELAAELGLKASGCRYTRGSYIFPQEQQYPQGSFFVEVEYLDNYCGQLGLGSEADILGDVLKEHKWHTYVASAMSYSEACEPVYTLKMCMTTLDTEMASKFYKGTTATDMTDSSGISNLLPRSQICDHAFEPCGYSMNGIEGSSLSTIHVTPEDGCSYASFEWTWEAPLSPKGYVCEGSGKERLPGRAVVVFHTFKAAGFSTGRL